MLFVTNFQLLPGEGIDDVLVLAESSSSGIHTLPVEYIGKVPNFDWLTQIQVVLPPTLSNAGEVFVSVNLRGIASNRARIMISASQVGNNRPWSFREDLRLISQFLR